ncbi:MAG: DegV family protein [Dehalococcoidia bacterium]|nr:DegV family protein [Dehalococcoidia bacterium]MDD5494818.1 DegV family protein [Dehalococcoidia bacterium]
MGVAIVTDTVSCLPGEIIQRYKVTVVPLEIVHQGKIFRDGIDITPAQFYEILSTSKELPSTSAPPPEVFKEIYDRLSKQGHDILVICPSAKLTHVYESALIAANMMQEVHPGIKLHVMDSGTAAGAQGFVVYAAAAAAFHGDDLSSVLNRAQEAMRGVHLVVCLDTLDYLARSGRVPSLIAKANTFLKIKPIIELLPLGKGVIPVSRVRTRLRAMDRVVEILHERSGSNTLKVIVQHTNAEQDANMLAKRIQSELICNELYIKDFTPVMGVHTGPGLLGVSFCLDKDIKIEK